jgi:hypothetical protein
MVGGGVISTFALNFIVNVRCLFVLVVSKKLLRKVPIFSLMVYAVRRFNRKRIKVGVVI